MKNKEERKRHSEERKARLDRKRAKYGDALRRMATVGRQIARFLLSRYFITILIIAAEVVLAEYLLFIIAENLLITVSLIVVLFAAGVIHLVNRETSPEYKITWLLIMLIPLDGVLLYFMFYDRRLSKKESKLLRDSYAALRDVDATAEIPKDHDAYGRVQALLHDDFLAGVYTGTSSKFFALGEDYFEALIADLKAAEKYIFLEYFIIAPGELWDRIHAVLKKKASEGIEVRLLYDDIGCMQTLPSYYEFTLRAEGIKAYRFGRVTPKVSAVHNNRDHRKIAVIDGRVGYTGGVNIADEYANIITRFGHWKDGGIRLTGSAVRGLLKLFLSAYDFTVGELSDYAPLFADNEPVPDADGGYYIPFGSGPAPVYPDKVGKNLFVNIINQAKKYVYITTPYLIIDYELTEALRKAATRGVSVKLVTPGIADKKIVKIMTKSAYPHLMSAGVEIYEYLPGFIHEKTLISDDRYLVSGTINLDYRSLAHHFEDGVLVIDSPVVDEALRAFEETLKKSDYRDENEARLTFIEWTFRNIIKLFAPLL